MLASQRGFPLAQLMLELEEVALVVAVDLREALLIVLALHLELAGEKQRVLLDNGLILLLLAALLELERRGAQLTANAVGGRGARGLRIGKLDELAVDLILDEAVHVVVAGVIPHALRRQLRPQRTSTLKPRRAEM